MGEHRIVQDPKVLVGKPTVRGTRISVELVLERLAAGETVDEVLENFPRLTRDDVLASLNYARAVIAQEIVPRPWRRHPDLVPKSASNKEKIMALAGVWGDLDVDALIDYIYKGRHEAPPSPPVSIE